ncbi:hypothetical protein M9Y10_014047 [Tritrichomonas musculus]|uniref:Uncharacterized protein n=1 Tax=Tritrichomonas musculus TaxID=1915356 RepID=A0ABR2KYF5_9EUKA
MLALLIALSISVDPIPGGWETISIDSEQIKTIKPYLDRNLPHLFPEIETNGYKIILAQMQVVNGMNLELIIMSNTGSFMFELLLFVDHDNKITITGIKRPLGVRPTFGGFNWQNPARFSNNDYLRLVRTIQKKVNLLVSKKGTVLVYRTQVVHGMRTHVIIKDSNQNVFSVITSKAFSPVSDDLVSVYQII